MTDRFDPTARIDTRLADLHSIVERMAANLLDFDTDPVRQLLDGAALRGATAEAWADAPDRLAGVWQGQTAVAGLVEAATERRRARRRLGDKERVELERMLWGPALTDPAPVAPGEASLTGVAPTAPLLTVDAVIAGLSATYKQLTDVVSRAGAVWERVLPRLNELDKQLAGGEEAARAAGARVPNEVAAVRRQLADLRERALADPLALPGDAAEDVETGVGRACAELADAQREAATIDDALTLAGRDLDSVAGTLDEARTAADEAETKVARWRRPTDDLARAVAELDACRTDLAAARRADEPTSAGTASRRLRAVRARIDALLGESQHLADACGAGLRTRSEMRGRLDAYRARAVAAGRAEDPDVQELAREAEAVLYAAPCDLAEASRLLTRFQEAVRAPSGRSA